MNVRHPLLLAAAIAFAFAVCSARAADGRGSRPNIVLILCDDMGFSDIGPYGGEIDTPHLDRLAAEGLRFTQFYNNAKCTTTRASLITGLYPRQNGPLLRDNMVTVAEVLREGGYRTALSGKWHLGATKPRRPSDRGFERYFGLLDGCSNFFDPSRPDPAFKGRRVRTVAKDDERITRFPDDFYMTDAISDYAAECINDFARKDAPFLLHVCYTAPHYPLHARPEDIAKYKGKYLKGWKALRSERHRRQVEMGLINSEWELPGLDPEATPWEDAPHKEWQDLRMAVYAAMIDRMDQGIGRILAALEKTGAADRTLVMFLSDNGGCAEIPGGEDPKRIPGPKEYYTTCGPGWAWAQNTPFRRYKSWVHEGGIATPLIVRWPGVVSPGSICREVGHIIDVLPTCAEAAGAAYPENRDGHDVLPVEGQSLLALFTGETRPGHEWLYWEWSGNRTVRHGNWKLCWDKKVRRWELYDLASDRTETRDLAASQPERVRQMSDRWTASARETGAKGFRENAGS
ncbi:MAG: arylsulfatase [Planctomycetes bacterium]|nr:arylsulfatase [Planctomycetota bacterium]